jgi:RNA polymerase sigma-70 factor (ECF subfamily)
MKNEELVDVARTRRAHCDEAMQILYQRLLPEVRRRISFTARRIRPEDVEDLASEVWISVMATLDRFDPQQANFKTWVLLITGRRTIDWIRRVKTRLRSERSLENGRVLPAPPAAEDFTGHLLHKETALEVFKALTQTPDGLGRLLLLCKALGLSYQDLAQVASAWTGREETDRTVEHRLVQTRKHLKKLLDAGQRPPAQHRAGAAQGDESAVNQEKIADPHPSAQIMRQRRTMLLEIYASRVRMVLAHNLFYHWERAALTRDELDQHTRNVLLLALQGVNVAHWPPDETTDRQVAQIIEDYLASPVATGDLDPRGKVAERS